MSTPFLKFSKKVFSKTLTSAEKYDIIYNTFTCFIICSNASFIHRCKIIKFNTQEYRSGHNEAVLKTVRPKATGVRIPLPAPIKMVYSLWVDLFYCHSQRLSNPLSERTREEKGSHTATGGIWRIAWEYLISSTVASHIPQSTRTLAISLF